MKKAPIAVALVLVFGLFAAAFSLVPAVAQNATNTTMGNATSTTTTTNTTTTSTNATGGETFSARGSIAALIFDMGGETTTTSDTTTASNDTSMTGNTTTSGNTTLSTGNDTTVMMPQVMTGDNDTGSTNMTGMESNMTTGTDNMTSTSNDTSTSAEELKPPYVLAGDWDLDVQDGNVTDFAANFTMVHIDGTGRHMHELSNFEPSGSSTIDTSGEGSSFLFGTVDVATNGEMAWSGADVLIIIEKNNVVSISLATEDTEDHFMGQPIYGIVESMTDADGNEMISTSTETSSDTMSNMTQGAEDAVNETGDFLSNVTEGITGGIEDLFNGTGQ